MTVLDEGGSASGYQVLLINTSGEVVAHAQAHAPRAQPRRTVHPSLTSASSTRVYFRDGDTNIMALSPSGAVTFVKSISAGSDAALGFSVSPDDTRIAVAVIDESVSPRTGRGYVEDVGDAGGHRDLWSNTGDSAVRWPVGWHDGDLIDQVGPYCLNGGNTGGCNNTVGYHVIDPATGSRVATVCQTSEGPNVIYGATASFQDESPLTAAGVACVDNEANGVTLSAVDWRGNVRIFDSSQPNTVMPVSGCLLSPDGTQMACAGSGDPSGNTLALLMQGGRMRTLSRQYNVLGWVDSSHLLIDVSSGTLGVLDLANDAEPTLPVGGVVSMTDVLPPAV